jgi:cobalt/nickel transport system permease protein
MGGHHHHAYFDPYSRLDSPIHRRSAGLKLAVALAIVVSVVFMPVNTLTAVTFYPFVFLFLVAVAGLSGVSPAFLIKRIALMEPVVLGAALLSIFQPDGWRIFLTLALRGTFCLATMILLANTTPFDDLLRVLRRLRMPAILLSILALMYRYLFVLTEELERLKRARASRTFEPTRKGRWRSMGSVVGHLFIRTTDRAERVYAAMCARGWE